jgi:hypothetical protein
MLSQFENPPVLLNKLTKRMPRLLYCTLGNVTFRKLIARSVQESTTLQFGNSPVLLNSTASSQTDALSAIWQVWHQDVLKVDSQCLGINVVTIRRFSGPPQVNKLSPRMHCLLYGMFGNETFRNLIVSVWESTLPQFGKSPVLLNSTSLRQGCVVCCMAGSATRCGRGFQGLCKSKRLLFSNKAALKSSMLV